MIALLAVCHPLRADSPSVQGYLTGRTWGFERPFRKRIDGCPCPFVLFRQTFACKNFFTNFFLLTSGY